MSKTIADNFFSDPRLLEAKKLLLEALEEHQRGLQSIHPSNPELKLHYKDLLKEFGQLRGGSLFFPYLGSGLGNGCLVELADGSVKYDFISGIGVHHWGHSHPALIEAAIDAALRDTIMQGNLQQIVECVDVTRDLLSAANRYGARLEHCFLSTSGAMANENALKLIFQKQYPADRLLAFEGCFMGRTLALSQVTDKPDYREGIPRTLAVDYVPYFDDSRPEESIRAAVDSVKRHMHRYPGKHAAMCFELVLGEGGFYPGSRDFFVTLMELAKENRLAVMLDEIQTFGRTEQLFAFQVLWSGSVRGRADPGEVVSVVRGPVRRRIQTSSGTAQPDLYVEHLRIVCRADDSPRYDRRRLFWTGRQDCQTAQPFRQALEGNPGTAA